MNIEKRIFNEFLHKARERLSIETENKQLKMIEEFENRLKRFLTERDFKYLMTKIRNKERLLQYSAKNWNTKTKNSK
jgi:hypothetical protein